MSLPSIAEVYARWHNPSCGFELHPDVNVGPPNTSENGILFHAIFLMVLDMLHVPFVDKSFTDDQFFSDVLRLETLQSGVFDRGAGDSALIDYKIRNENSHDNYLGICCGLYFSNHSYRSAHVREEIASHGLKNFFIYNNVKPRISLPMNPGNWSVFLATSEKHNTLVYLFLPFFIINFIITNFIRSWVESFLGKPQSTSGKQLYLLMLYTLRKHPAFKLLYKIYVKRMQKVFGDDFINEIFKIYYLNPNHPIRLYAANIKLQEIL